MGHSPDGQVGTPDRRVESESGGSERRSQATVRPPSGIGERPGPLSHAQRSVSAGLRPRCSVNRTQVATWPATSEGFCLGRAQIVTG